MTSQPSRARGRIRNRLRESAAARGVLAIISGTAIGQAVAVLASPILTRLFTPSEFGSFSIVAALAVVLGAIPTLRFELAVPLPASDDDGRALVSGGLVIGAIFAALATAIAIPSAQPLATALGDPALAPYLWLVPVLAVTMAYFRMLNQWALRQQRYVATARRNVVLAVTTVALQIGAGLRGLGTSGLIAGLAIGQVVGTVSLLFGAGLGLRQTTREQVRSNLWRYRRFAYLLAPAGLINAVAFYVPLVLVGAFYGPLAAGYFGLAQRVLGLPLALIGQAVSQVYVSDIAKTRRTGGTVDVAMFRRVSVRLAVLAVALGTAIFLLSPALFPLIFGQEWEKAGLVSQALAVSVAFQFVASPISQTLVVFERNATQLLWDALRTMATVGAIVWAHNAGAPLVAAVWVTSLVQSVAYLASWELSRRVVEGR